MIQVQQDLKENSHKKSPNLIINFQKFYEKIVKFTTNQFARFWNFEFSAKNMFKQDFRTGLF